MANSSASRLVSVLAPYDVTYMARQGRIVRSETVAEVVKVQMRTPGPDQASVAFRITSVASSDGVGPKIDVREVVYCDGALWWPLNLVFGVDSHKSAVGPDISEEDLLRILETGTEDILGLGIDYGSKFGQLGRLRQLGLVVREWKHNDPEAALLLVQRRIDHLMVWNGKAYGRGGEPAYVQRPISGQLHADGTVNTGADRSVEPRDHGLALDVGRFEFGQLAFMYGKFQRADEYDAAVSNRSATNHASQAPDRIEVLMPHVMKLNRGELRLDAIYRATSRALFNRDELLWAGLRDVFADTTAKDCASSATSKARFDAMLTFVEIASNQNQLPAELDEAYRCFLDFEKSPELSEIGSLLTEAEDEVLAALAAGTAERPGA